MQSQGGLSAVRYSTQPPEVLAEMVVAPAPSLRGSFRQLSFSSLRKACNFTQVQVIPAVANHDVFANRPWLVPPERPCTLGVPMNRREYRFRRFLLLSHSITCVVAISLPGFEPRPAHQISVVIPWASNEIDPEDPPGRRAVVVRPAGMNAGIATNQRPVVHCEPVRIGGIWLKIRSF